MGLEEEVVEKADLVERSTGEQRERKSDREN